MHLDTIRQNLRKHIERRHLLESPPNRLALSVYIPVLFLNAPNKRLLQSTFEVIRLQEHHRRNPTPKPPFLVQHRKNKRRSKPASSSHFDTVAYAKHVCAVRKTQDQGGVVGARNMKGILRVAQWGAESASRYFKSEVSDRDNAVSA